MTRQDWQVTNFKRRYGITVQEYDEILEVQNNACAICERPASDFAKRLHVDHDHDTLKVRGLLCTWCNVRLAVLEDPDWMDAGYMYLAKKETDD